MIQEKLMVCIRCQGRAVYKTSRPVRCLFCLQRFKRFSSLQRRVLKACLTKEFLTHEQVALELGISRTYVSDLCNKVGVNLAFRKSLLKYPTVYQNLTSPAIKFLKSINAF